MYCEMAHSGFHKNNSIALLKVSLTASWILCFVSLFMISCSLLVYIFTIFSLLYLHFVYFIFCSNINENKFSLIFSLIPRNTDNCIKRGRLNMKILIGGVMHMAHWPFGRKCAKVGGVQEPSRSMRDQQMKHWIASNCY